MFKFLFQVLLELVLTGLLFFNVFVSNNASTTFCLIVLTLFLILNILIYKYRTARSRYLGEAKLIVLSLCTVLIGIFYVIGFKTGFNVSLSSIFKNYIATSTWIKVFIIVIMTELIRAVVMTIDTRSKVKNFILYAIMVINFVLIDVTIDTKSYTFGGFNQIYEFFAVVFVPSLAKNILLCYISKNNGYQPTIIYRIIMDLYIYFLPVYPKINMFIKSCILLVFPYVVYAIIRDITSKVELGPARKKQKEDGIGTYITTILFAILVALVSREFEYCMIAIGSGSMTGTINKGDAIIYQVYDEDKMDLKEGDVIVFNKQNVSIVHRIIKVYSIDGKDAYQTKGDANESADNWIVSQEEVQGIVKKRIILIAWPSVLLNELF